MDDERIRRPRLERTRPIRSAGTLFTAASGTGGERRDDVVARSVELGYQVVDAYIRRGQEAARRVSAGDYRPQDLMTDARELATRMVRSAAELAAAWGDMFDLTTRQGGASAGDASPRAPDSAQTDTGTSTRDPVALRMRLEGPRVVEAVLELSGVPTTHPLVVPPLRTTTPDGPVLGGVTVAAGVGGVRTIVLAVPPDHPAGTYAGPVLDDHANCPVGWLTVTVVDGSQRNA